MQLTQRDIDILKFINEFGFCEMSHIQKKFSLRHPRSYQVITRLLEKELVRHERILHARKGAYRLTSKGAELTPLLPLHRIALGKYEHDLKIIDVYLTLIECYPEAHWVSERWLQHEKYDQGFKERAHVADGILTLPDKKIAIEVELSLKSKQRLTKIIKDYHTEFAISEVWYFCSSSVVKHLHKLTSHTDLIKVVELEKFLYEPKKFLLQSR